MLYQPFGCSMLFSDLFDMSSLDWKEIPNQPELEMSSSSEIRIRSTGKILNQRLKEKTKLGSFEVSYKGRNYPVYTNFLTLFGRSKLIELGFKPVVGYQNSWINREGLVFLESSRKFTFGSFFKKEENNYRTVSLKKINEKNFKHVFIHRLVLLTFKEPDIDPSKIFVNHKDGIKYNNHLDNLEWVTKSENAIHYFEVLNGTPNGKGKVGIENKCSIPIKATHKETGEVLFFDSYASAKRERNFTPSEISTCCGDPTKIHKNYYWEKISKKEYLHSQFDNKGNTC